MNAPATRPALFERFPDLEGCVEWTPLGAGHTPVERLDTKSWPGAPEIWVKRDDRADAVYGGNKVRTLEFLIGGGAGPVITVGPTGSHHVLATALHAESLGRPCYALLTPQRMTAHHEEIHARLTRRCAGILSLQSGYPRRFGPGLLRDLARLLVPAKRARIVGPGGASPRGTLGHVSAGIELADQIRRAELPHPREVFVPFGTGGTASGLALGFALAGMRTPVVAVRVVPRPIGLRAVLTFKAVRTWRLLHDRGLCAPLPDLRLRVEHRFAGPGYAHPTPEAERALDRAAAAGLPLETTYTAKAFAALLHHAETRPGGPRLFIQTYAGSVRP